MQTGEDYTIRAASFLTQIFCYGLSL